MNWHYYKVAWRSLLKKDGTILFNILGLGISLGAAITLFCVVFYEFSFDKYHTKSDRIYRVVQRITSPKDVVVWAPSGGVYTAPFKAEIPEVEELVRFSPSWVKIHISGQVQRNLLKTISGSTGWIHVTSIMALISCFERIAGKC